MTSRENEGLVDEPVETRCYIRRHHLNTQELLTLDLDEMATYRRRLIMHAYDALSSLRLQENGQSVVGVKFTQVQAFEQKFLGRLKYILKSLDTNACAACRYAL